MKISILFIFHLLYLGVCLTFPSGITLAAETQPSVGANIIQYADDHLSLKVKDISLAHLLQEIAHQSGFIVLYNGSLDETITLQLNQFPLEEGLRKILQQHNFAVEYVQQINGENQSTVIRPVKLWIFYKGKKAGPYNTLQTAMTTGDPGEQEGAETLDEYEYDPETIVREYKAKTVAKALLKEKDSGILELSEAMGGEMSATKVKELIEKALEGVDEEIKGELLKELEDIIETIK